ncbi:MAG: autotransporter-associated beta strand repeat-containing protein [Planctomycetota bacterium]
MKTLNITFPHNAAQVFAGLYRRGQRRGVTLAAAAALFLGPPTLAQSTWIGQGFTDNWTNPLNWVGGVPEKDPLERISFENRGPSTLNEDWTLFALEIGTGGIRGEGDWRVSNGSRLTLHGTINYTGSGCDVSLDCSPQIFFPIILGNNASLTTQSTANARIDYLANINTNGFFLVSNAMGATIHYRSTVSGGGGFIQRGPKASIFYGKNSYTGPTLIEQGTLRLFDDGFLPDQSVVTIEAPGTLRIDPVTSGGRTDAIAGLRGAGSVDLRGGSRLFMGNITANSPGTGNFSGTIFGSGGIGKRGSGTQTLNGTLNFDGNILVQGGKLTLGPAANVLQIPDVSVSDGATFQIDSASHFGSISNTGHTVVNGQAKIDSFSGTGNLTIDNDITIGSLGGSSAISIAGGKELSVSGDFSGVISGAGGLNINTLTVLGRQAYTGTTTVDTLGLLSVVGSGRLSDTSVIDMRASSLLSLGSGITDAIGGLNGIGTVRLNAGAALVIGNYAGFDSVGEGDYSGLIEGDGSLVKRGSTGTQVLRDYNSYTGGTVVEEGVLELRSPDAPTGTTPSMLGSGSVTVKTGGTLAGIGSTGPGLVTVTDGRLRPGIDGAGKLLMDALAMSEKSTLSIDLQNADRGGFSQIEVLSTAALDGSIVIDQYDITAIQLGDSFDIVTAESITGVFHSLIVTEPSRVTFEVQYLSDVMGTRDVVRLTAVPTPSSLALIVPMGLLFTRIRRGST